MDTAVALLEAARAVAERIVELDRRIAEAERQRDELRTLESQLLSQAEAMESGLTTTPNAAKLRYEMQPQTLPAPNPRKVGRPLSTDHPFTAALAARQITMKEWADSHGVKRERVKSWVAKGTGGRPIPREIADAIEAEFTDKNTKTSVVPATRRTWKNGIRD